MWAQGLCRVRGRQARGSLGGAQCTAPRFGCAPEQDVCVLAVSLLLQQLLVLVRAARGGVLCWRCRDCDTIGEAVPAGAGPSCIAEIWCSSSVVERLGELRLAEEITLNIDAES